MAELYSVFTIFDDLIEVMLQGKELPVDKIHLCGSRYCSKTFSTQHFTLKSMLLVEGVGALALRQDVNMSSELFDEYKEMAEDDFGSLLTSNITKKQLRYGKNKLAVKGLKSNTKSKGLKKPGLAKYQQCKYIIMHVEEAFEIDEGDKRDIRQSLRSNKDTQVLEINTCNPASLGMPYIKYLNQHFKFNEQELREKGYQYSGILNIPNKTPEGIVYTREIFLYVNWRCVQEVLSKQIIRDIRATWSKDPARAKTIDIGMPGDVEGSIFGNLMKHVSSAFDTRHDAVRFGVDYGWGTSGNRSPTVAMCMGISPETIGYHCYGRYSHDNGVEYLDQNIQVDRLLAWMNMTRDRLIKRGIVSQYEQIYCMFDNAHVGVIAMMQNRVREKRWDWLVVRPCDTKNVVTKITQIEIMKMIICNGMLGIDDKYDTETRHEFSSIKWDDEKEEKMDHQFSHGFDAMIYAIGSRDLLRAKDRDPTYFIYGKERAKW